MGSRGQLACDEKAEMIYPNMEAVLIAIMITVAMMVIYRYLRLTLRRLGSN